MYNYRTRGRSKSLKFLKSSEESFDAMSGSHYEFGQFRLFPAERLLLRGTEAVALAPRAFDTLLLLVKHRGRILEKEALMEKMWPGAFVEENNLNQLICTLRKALGEGACGARYIETVSRRGYRFVASVKKLSERAERNDEYLEVGMADALITRLSHTISEQVARALEIVLSGGEKHQLTKRYTGSSEAYQAYLKGRYFWNKRTEENIKKGISYFNLAIEIDPAYASPYCGLADAYLLLGFYRTWPPKQVFPKAKAAALKALEIDDTLVDAKCCLAYVRACYEWDWLGAEQEFRRILEVNPNHAMGRHWYSTLLSAFGRLDEALAEEKRALELDPLSLIVNHGLALMLYFAGQYDSAIEQLRETVELDPNFALGRWSLGRVYRQQGRYEEAMIELRKAIELSGRSPLMVAALGRTYAVSGQRDEARGILDELRRMSRQQYVSPYDIAAIYSGLREKDQTFEWLNQACEEHSGRLFYFNVDPYWDWLRSDARFVAVLRRLGLVLSA